MFHVKRFCRETLLIASVCVPGNSSEDLKSVMKCKYHGLNTFSAAPLNQWLHVADRKITHI